METFLLDKESKYILEIINQLSKAPHKEMSFKDLETQLGITKYTIKIHFKTLLTYCKQNHLNAFAAENGKLKMLAGADFNTFTFYHQMIQKSVKYQILTKILGNPDITFTDLHHDLSISKSNCSVHIKQLNQFLESYYCKINFLQKNPIQGKEHQIRFLYYNLFWGLDLHQIIVDSPSLDKVCKLLLEFVPHMTYSTLSKLKLSFYIFQIASQNGYFITSEDDFSLQDSPYIKYDDFFERLDAIDFLKNCPDLETKQRECRYLYFLFCRINFLTLKECEDSNIQIAFSNSPSTQYFIEQFQEKSHLILKQDELKYLHYNLSLLNQEAAIFRGRIKVFGLKDSAIKVGKKNRNTSKFIKHFLQYICEDNQAINKLVQDFPILQYHYATLLKVVIKKHSQPVKLLVQTNYSVLYRETLVSEIINATPFPVDIYTSEQLNGEKPDGIISNWIPEKKYEGIPFFSVSSFYTDWNQTELNYFLSYLTDKKNTLPYSLAFSK